MREREREREEIVVRRSMLGRWKKGNQYAAHYTSTTTGERKIE
jgi:hypothetical protein